VNLAERSEAELEVETVRADFPALASGTAFFDAPGGTQTPRQVGEAIATALASPLSNRGLDNPAQRNAEEIVQGARRALADFTGAEPGGVVFGRSATQLTFDLSRALAREWSAGDEVVVSRLDHDANIRPWVIAAEAVGARVRWADFDVESTELRLEHLAPLLSDRTRLVAVTGASNLLGTRPDVAALAAAVHDVGALFWVDAVHLAAHQRIDRAALGADFLVCSPYKFLGPHHGVLVADPDRLAGIRPDKLLPSTDAVPERFELGTLPYELLAGTTAAVDYLAGLGGLGGSGGTRPDRLDAAFRRLHRHELTLQRRLETGLAVLGARVHSRARVRTSTVLFDLPGHPGAEVARQLAARGVNAPAGTFYAVETSRHLGLGDTGAVRVGLAPYSDASDVDRLLGGLADLAGAAAPTRAGPVG
jgi:cysteine desulfurase family protein (TIGR01976 family)